MIPRLARPRPPTGADGRNHSAVRFKRSWDQQETQRDYHITEDAIEKTVGNKVTSYQWETFDRFGQDDNYFFLCNKDAYLVFSRQGFGPGEEEAFSLLAKRLVAPEKPDQKK